MLDEYSLLVVAKPNMSIIPSTVPTYILNLVVATLDTCSQVMVLAKAQHVHHSTVYDHHACMRLVKYEKLYFSENAV